ncbi:MAG: hypothetical protein H6Q73_3089 [Firmicutes bacterium]|nr:hypothetical protein [Bacillota bacterium]
MKNLLVRVLTVIIVLVVLFCPKGIVNAAKTTKILDEDTKITPPGVMATIWMFIPEFKKGTTVILNDNDEVLEGTLTSYEILTSAAKVSNCYINLSFKPRSRVTFNDEGKVIKGTIERAVLPVGQLSSVMVKDGTEVSFHDNGILATFTLVQDTYLRPVGWRQTLRVNFRNKVKCSGLVEFKGETQVELNEKGEVTKGTLNKDTRLLSPDGSINVYAASTTVEFDENGVVIKAVKPAN